MSLELSDQERHIAAAIGFDEAVVAIVKDETDGILFVFGRETFSLRALVVVLITSVDSAGIVDRLNQRLAPLGCEAFAWTTADQKPYLCVLPNTDPATFARHRTQILNEPYVNTRISAVGHPGDWEMYLAFDTLTPEIAGLPHCVMRAVRENIQIILDVTGDTAGWFGKGPWSFFGFEDTKDVTDALSERFPDAEQRDDYLCNWEGFKIWEHPSMQARILQHGHAAGFDENSAFVSTSIDKAAFDAIDTNEDTDKYVARHITGLRWAWFSLWWESDDILFVVPPNHAAWIDEVIARVKSGGHYVKQMKWGRKRYYLEEL